MDVVGDEALGLHQLHLHCLLLAIAQQPQVCLLAHGNAMESEQLRCSHTAATSGSVRLSCVDVQMA